MYLFHIATSLFVPRVISIKAPELLRSPRWYAVLTALALLGDILVACAVPIGVLCVLLSCGMLGMTWVAIIGGFFFSAALTIKLGRLELLSEIHSTLIWSGTLYVFDDGWRTMSATSSVGVTKHESIPCVYGVGVPGLALWIAPTMRQFKPLYRRHEEPLNYGELERAILSPKVAI